MAVLTCPRCPRQLTAARSPAGIVYVCERCLGRLASLAVLRRDPATEEFTRAVWLSAREAAPGDRPCPHCRRLMRVASMSCGHGHTRIDVCMTCQSVWFDPMEYSYARDEGGTGEKPGGDLHPEARLAEAKLGLELDGMRAEQAATARGDAPDEKWKWLPALLGMPVEVDAPRLKKTPVVTWALLGLLAAAYYLSASNLSGAIAGLGFVPAQWSRLGGLTLVTSFFLHGGFWHLASNAYFLVIFGDNVEDRLGRARFIALIAASHLAGMALHGLLDPRNTMPCVGASAGVFGVMACYAATYPRARLAFLLFYIKWLRVPAWAMFGFYCVMQLVGAWLQVGGYSNVSSLAHIGGLCVGLAVAFWPKSGPGGSGGAYLRSGTLDSGGNARGYRRDSR